MNRVVGSMFFRALFAFLVLPGLAAIVAPLLIAHVYSMPLDPWWPGTFVILLGAVVLLWCVRDFYESGKGTLAPWDPPKKIVVIGLYRVVRNPMYVGVVLLILGWAALFRSWILVAYALVLFAVFHCRVVVYEEPWLQSRFPETWPD